MTDPKPNLPAVRAGTDIAGGQGGVRALDTYATDVGMEVWTSLPASRKGELIGFLQGGADKLGDVIGQTIAVEHIVAHRVDLLDEETGEISVGDRIVLIQPDGTAFAAVSAGIRKSVALITALYGMPPYAPALKVKVEQLTTRRGRRTYTLTPVAGQ